MSKTPKDHNLGFWSTVNKIYHEKYFCSSMILTVARFSGNMDESLLRQAMLYYQRRHPLLGAAIAEGKRYFHYTTEFYDGADEATRAEKLPLYIHERDHEDRWKELSEAEMNQDFAQDNPYLWRLVWVRNQANPAGDHEFLLLTHHAIADAGSTTALLHDYLHAVTKLAAGESLPELEPLPIMPAPEKLISPKNTDDLTEPTHDESQVRHIYYQQEAPLAQRRNCTHFVAIDAKTMGNLVAKCKQEGAKVNAALSAALMLASSTDSQADHPIVFSFAASLRPYCDIREVDDSHFGNFVTMLQAHPTYKICETSADFWELARHVHEETTAVLQYRARTGFFQPKFPVTMLEKALDADLTRATEQKCFLFGAALSNLGRLPYDYACGNFQLNEMYFSNTLIAGHYLLFNSVINLHNQLFCCINFTEPLYSRKDLEALTQKFLDTVSEYAQ